MDQLATKFCYILFGANPLLTTFFYIAFLLAVYLVSKKFKGRNWMFLAAFIPSLLFAARLIFNDYFLSDDFDHFVLADKYTFWEIFQKGVSADNLWAFHRLFTAFWLFKLVHLLFGTNYPAFVIVNLVIHIANTFFVYLLLKKVIKNDYVNALGAFIFNSFYLTWISNIHELLAAFFFLSTFLILLKNNIESKTPNIKLTFLSLLTFILGIYSKEIVFVLPFCFFMFLIFAKNYTQNTNFKNLNLIKSLLKIKYILALSFVYFLVFIKDFTRFSSFASGSGYDTVYSLGSFLTRLAFYISDKLPLFAGVGGLLVFLAILVLHDVLKKKLILIPLILSYLALILPVLFLSKYTSYYNYLPFIFLTIILAVFLEKLFVNKFLFLVLSSLFLVFVLKHNIATQDNCFLIQFPREHPRKTAVEYIVGKVKNNEKVTEEDLKNLDIKWFVDNGYLKYFLK